MNRHIVTLDVRDDIRNGREPFSKIMSTAARLHPEESFLLVAPFEPVPLFGVLAKQGFAHKACQMENGDWEVLFTRTENDPTEPCGSNRMETVAQKSKITNEKLNLCEVDVRGLEPPQPMVKILETLSALPDGTELRARTDRRPMHLYAQLEARGFHGQTEEQNDGSFVTIIRRS